MKLLEYEAKKILADFSMPIPKGVVINRTPITPPVVLKSQVPIGGRGKAGGIKIAHTTEEVETLIPQLLALPIKGFTPTTLLAEELLDIDKELYLSLIINRQDETIELLAHKEGGVEIESHDAKDFLRTPLTPHTIKQTAKVLAATYQLPSTTNQLEDLLIKLLACFIASDATLLEINPLVLTKQGKLVAGDAKITLDDSAAFRHPDWNFEDTNTEANFVTLDTEGAVATIANGAGLAMATVDAVADAGLTPANFLDIGGGANSKTVLHAFNRIMEFPRIEAIVINIFAGITRCDEVAKAIIEAQSHIENLPPLFIRLAGTNVEQAKSLLAKRDVPLLPTLEACIEAAKKEVTHG